MEKQHGSDGYRWLPPRNLTPAKQYALAVVATLCATGLAQVLPYSKTNPVFAFFFIAVWASAWVGGMSVGLFACALSFLEALYFLLPPRYSFALKSSSQFFRLMIQFSVSAVGVLIVAKLRSAVLQNAELLAQREEHTTVLRDATAELHQSRESLRVTLTSIGDAVMTADTNGRITFLNPVAVALTGWTAEEAQGQQIQDVFRIINEQTHSPAEDIVFRVLDEGRIFELANHTALITKDGHEVPIEDSAAPIFNRDGKVIGVVLVFHDVTEKRHKEKQLLKLNRTLKALSSSNQALLHATGEAPLLEQVCKIITEDCGHAMVWIGFTENDEDKTVRPVAHSGFDEGYLKSLHISWGDTEYGQGPTGTAIRTGQPSCCRNMLTDPNFEPWREEALRRGYASSLVLPLIEAGLAFGTITIYSKQGDAFSDDEVNLLLELTADLANGISTLRVRAAREQAEESLRENRAKLEAALASMTDAVFISDVEGRFIHFNEAFVTYYRFKSKDECAKTLDEYPDFLDVFMTNGESAPMEMWAAPRALRGETVTNAEYALRRKDTGEAWVGSYSFAPIRDQDGTIVGAVVVGRDITDRKRAEEALLRSEKLAVVGRMAASIAHEINNPLAAVMNSLYLARTSADKPESVRRYIDMADDELKRISHITRQTLGFYRESSAPTTVDVNSILDSAVDLLRGKVKVKGAKVEKQNDCDLQITAVSGELRQVFSNLLANSLDAMGEGGTIRLRVSKSTCVNSGQTRIRVTVADDGKGIDSSVLPRIFEPLFTTKESTGSGLGLWVSKQLIDKHQGSIRVRTSTSDVRRGTVFSVVIPADPVQLIKARAAAAT